jgi:hypothetical protein
MVLRHAGFLTCFARETLDVSRYVKVKKKTPISILSKG